jgi:hypothetical protein
MLTRRKNLIICSILLICKITQGEPVLAQEHANPKLEASGHASLRAYPDAVLSVTDRPSGLTVTVDADGSGLTATNAAGAVVWHKDVIGETGAPATGSPVIRQVSITTPGTVSLVIGKHRYVDADLSTGALHLQGED